MSAETVQYSREALGAVIRRHRNRVGLSQEELGRQAHYQSGAGVAISRIESGQIAVGSARLAQLAEPLGVTADQLTAEARADTSGSDAGATPASGSARASVAAGNETLRKRRARVELRVKQRQEVLDGGLSALKERRQSAEDGFVLPFITVAREIEGAPQLDGPERVDADSVTPDVRGRTGVELARFDVAELLRLARPLQHVGPPLGQAAQLAALKLVTRFGTASTGRMIRVLHGVARERAVRAQLGLGSKASGGFGIRGGNFVLNAVGVAPVVLLAVGGGAAIYQATRLQAVTEAEAELDASQDRFDAVSRALEQSAAVLDEIAVFATRRLERWQRDLPEGRPMNWDDLTEGQHRHYNDFITLVACFLAVVALDLDQFLEENVPLSEVVAEANSALDESAQKVAELL